VFALPTPHSPVVFREIVVPSCSQADVAILVVSAIPKEFEAGFGDPVPIAIGDPFGAETSSDRAAYTDSGAAGGGQTKENAILLRSLGVRNIIVAVNKMDQVGSFCFVGRDSLVAFTVCLSRRKPRSLGHKHVSWSYNLRCKPSWKPWDTHHPVFGNGQCLCWSQVWRYAVVFLTGLCQ
jgi:hypothetical protein